MNFLMIVFSFFALSLMLVFLIGTKSHSAPNPAIALPLSILPGIASIIYGFSRLKPYAEIITPSQIEVAKMQTEALMTLALGECGVLCSIFTGGRLVVESVIAIVLFALSIAIIVLPTGLTVFNNYEKNKSE